MLYAKEIPEYRKIVQRYYKQIHDMPPLSEQEMNAHLAEESRVRGGEEEGEAAGSVSCWSLASAGSAWRLPSATA